MGRIVYGATGSVDVEDRTLAHLQILIAHKLRRSEPFMLDITTTDGTGHRVLWIHPAVPIQLHFFGNRNPRINRTWIDQLVLAANRPNAVSIDSEPVEHPESAAPSPSAAPHTSEPQPASL